MTESERQRVAEIVERAEKATPGPWRTDIRDGLHRIYDSEGSIHGRNGIAATDYFAAHFRQLRLGTAGCDPLNVPQDGDGMKNHPAWREAFVNAAFIAASREDVPFLLALVKRQAAALERVEALCALCEGVDPLPSVKADADGNVYNPDFRGPDPLLSMMKKARAVILIEPSRIRAALTESTEGAEPDGR